MEIQLSGLFRTVFTGILPYCCTLLVRILAYLPRVFLLFAFGYGSAKSATAVATMSCSSFPNPDSDCLGKYAGRGLLVAWDSSPVSQLVFRNSKLDLLETRV